MLGPVRETWTFDWLGPNLTWKGDLTPYVLTDPPPQVQHDASQSVKRSMRFYSLNLAGVDTLQDLVRPHYRLLMGDGGWADWTLGTFLLMPPQREVNEPATILNYTALDFGQILVDDEFEVAYTVKAGANPVYEIQKICASIGGRTPIRVQIQQPFATIGQDLVWDGGTTKLRAINDILAAITFRPAWFDEQGVLRSAPIPDYNSVSPSWTWDASAGNSIVTSTPLREVPDWSNAFNVIRVKGEDPRTTPATPLYAKYEITRPDSPINVSKFRRKVKVVSDTRLASQQACSDRARAEGQAAARIFANVTLSTLAWPVSQDYDVYQGIWKTADEGLQSWPYLETGWTMYCGVGLETQHVIQRITPA